MKCLLEADSFAKSSEEREHVTPYFYRHPERFKLGNLSYDTDESSQRWTVDTPDDFKLISKIIESLYPINPSFSMEDILALLKKHPDWLKINAHVLQKELGQK